MKDRVAYTIVKTFELICFLVGVCISVFLVGMFVSLLAEIHPLFWFFGVVLVISAIYFFCTYDDGAWRG